MNLNENRIYHEEINPVKMKNKTVFCRLIYFFAFIFIVFEMVRRISLCFFIRVLFYILKIFKIVFINM